MRIISGKFKGKSIDFIKSTTTRPLKDSVKENIFNILLHSNLFNIEIEKSNFHLSQLLRYIVLCSQRALAQNDHQAFFQ